MTTILGSRGLMLATIIRLSPSLETELRTYLSSSDKTINLLVSSIAKSQLSIYVSIILAIIAFLALFKDVIWEWVKRPKLEAAIINGPPDCTKTGMYINRNDGGKASVEGYQFRIRVKNLGQTKAENVEVYAYSLEKEENGRYAKEKTFLPINLVWTHYGLPFFSAISNEMEKHCDLGIIIKPDERRGLHLQNILAWKNPETGKVQEYTGTILSLSVLVYPYTKSHLILKGKYKLLLKIAASNAKPVDRALKIELDGEWSDSEEIMLDKHVKLSF